MLIVTGAIVARPDTLDLLLAEAQRHVAQSRTEPGCLLHSFHQDGENPLRIFFYEQWESRDALRAHFAHPGARQLMAAVREHAAAAEPLAIHEATEVRP